jgi:8-oxo-dGTP pyrophosphatase MutT (NUDIX family)
MIDAAALEFGGRSPPRLMDLSLFTLPPPDQRKWLVERLSRPPPFKALHLSDGFRLPGREGEPRSAAVLVPIVNRPAGLVVLFTERSADLPDHAGQISFPGGRVEADDRDVDAAALRETEEEIGLPRNCVTVLGRLADYETVTGYRVTPVVGWVEPPFPVVPDPVEVADVFEVPLAFLLEPSNQKRHFRMLGELRRDYFAIPYGNRYIWGATAAMLMILDRTLRTQQDLPA